MKVRIVPALGMYNTRAFGIIYVEYIYKFLIVPIRHKIDSREMTCNYL